MPPFDIKRAAALDAREQHDRWLVCDLWSEQAVGIVGGEPKCCKSFLALDLAVAVASGAPALRRFAVQRSGTVLLYAAEDALHVVRARLCGICQIAGVRFDDLDVQVITAPSVRLDLEADRARLLDTVADVQPVLLVLDPFVRLHRIDENAAAEVAPLLAYLRELQRRFETSVLLVHHAKKGAANARAGQALRGSSELHAWGDSNLYLRRQRDQLLLSIEHRAAPSVPAVAIELAGNGHAVALALAEHRDHQPAISDALTPAERIEQALAAAARPLSRRALRAACRIRASSLSKALAVMIADGTAVETATGICLPR